MKTANFLKIMMLFLAIGVASCSSNSTDDGTGGGSGGGGTTGLTIESDKSQVYTNTLVNFTVRDASGAVVTSTAVITVDGTPIAGSSALLSGVGVKNAVATVGTETSNTLAVEVIAPSFTTKALIEDYTGAWCGWCPRISQGIIDVHNSSNGDDVIAVAVHNGDSMAFPLEGQMRSQFGVNGFPTGILNRADRWSSVSGDAMNIQQPLQLLNAVKPVGLAINSSVSGSTVNATVKVGFDIEQSNLKLVAVLLQNGVVASQTNYTSNFGGGSSLPNFVHNDILKAAFTDIFGDAIPAAEQVGGGVYSVDLSATSSGVNSSDWDIVAFVVNASGEVVNVQKASVGSNKDFD
ncbi:MAG: Omp28-related outer membrane protein [Nonlabens sp.]|uniref:Omp28-related outer membrane protein n=1 Tax=Nonlabens sp. TaxID=1888209 RepID=UPI003EF37FDD